MRLRFPLAIFNTGAKALIVSDLRVALDDEPDKAPLEWITTRRLLRPGSDDEHAFATPFAVQGRETREVIAEFGDERSWQPLPGVPQRLRLQAQVHPRDEWVDLVVFEWWPAPENASAYLTYRNQPPPARG